LRIGAVLLCDGRWDFLGGLGVGEATDELVAGQKTFLDLLGLLQEVVVDLLGDNRVFSVERMRRIREVFGEKR
jgi:hypothetical protein